jgi:hypothetical protein
MGSFDDQKRRFKKSGNDEIGVSGAYVRSNSAVTNGWIGVITTQDHLIRKMNEKAMGEIPIKKIFYWLQKCHEALIAVDELNEAMAMDLRLGDIYKRSALIEAIRTNIEAQEKAEELLKNDGKGYGKD